MKPNLQSKILLFAIFLFIAVQTNAQKIGFLLDGYIIDRWYIDQKLFMDRVRELGGEPLLEVAYGDTVEQVRLAKKLIDDGVKTLVVVPIDARQAAKIVAIAKAAHIPVIAYDRLILSNDVSLYVSYNNEKVGELQAGYALKKVPQGNYVVLSGPTSDNNALQFRSGQLKILEPQVKNGKVKVIGDFTMEDWGELGALMKIDEFISKTSEKPAVILASNDALASGAIQALPPDLLGKVIITGQDADMGALKNIISGSQTMTIYKPIKPLAYMAAEMAIKLAKGESLKGTTKMQSGKITVNAVLLDPVVVDKSNYKETVVKDGHASLSEIMGNKK
jgi:D-xylose transport system substrate-binding protein